MKIAIFLPDFRKGGAQAMMINLANHWAETGNIVTMVSGTSAGGWMEKISPAVQIVCGTGNGALSGFIPLCKALKKENPDILFSALYHANIIASLAAFLTPGYATRVVLSERNHLSSSLKDVPLLRRLLLYPLIVVSYRLADRIIAISNGVRDNLINDFHLPAEKALTVYNPVITPGFAEKISETAQHEWFQNRDYPVVIAAGRLVPQKDYPTLLMAFARLTEKNRARLLILGTGYLELELKDLCLRLGIADRVAFIGQVDNPLAYMKQADLFVLSSAWEGFGNVLVEALYCGLPIVATNCPSGPSEILEGGKYGTLVPPKDPDALARAIEAAILSPKPSPETQKSRALDFAVPKIADQYQRA
jgi:glycosyltransferase involved in cell wall biosynthesis